MKGMTIALAGVLLMLGTGAARAADVISNGSSVAATVTQAAPETAASDSSATLYLETDPDFTIAGDTGLAVGRSLPMWNYALSPQLTVDLGFRPSRKEEAGFDLVRDSAGVEQIARNLMLGFRYHF